MVTILSCWCDSLSADLPYFGERQMGGGYNTEGSGIAFKGNAERYEAKFDKKNQRYDVQFRIRNKMEMFNVRLVLFPNMTGTMWISSNQSFAIRFNGKMSEVEEIYKEYKQDIENLGGCTLKLDWKNLGLRYYDRA